LANPSELIRRVYAYVAYLIGPGADAEDVTSEVFERAVRYRESYDRSRGEPLSWLLGIARRCVDDAVRRARMERPKAPDPLPQQDLEAEAIERLTVAAALARLDERAQDLLALRYGADLTARQIGELLDLRTNAVEVALHRALSRLRPELEEPPTSTMLDDAEARLLPPVEPSPSASQK
jgi:RNA polymerase sigma-70 factor (ECF subfamily)